MEHIIIEEMLGYFQDKMAEEEKSPATIKKYLRDVRMFEVSLGERKTVTKDVVILYKSNLAEKYTYTSVNSMLASLNHFFQVMGWEDCKVRAYKIQREAFRSNDREMTRNEYIELLDVAKRRHQDWLYLIMLTICSTGIRVSELPFITVEALDSRRARVSLKGKTRTVILPVNLCRELKKYVEKKQILSGSIFVTRNGNPIDRSNICHAMKKLCQDAGVKQSKIFPHNLRHLFAVTYYKKERDISHLADLLGHSNINTTRIYTMVSSTEQEQQINELGLV